MTIGIAVSAFWTGKKRDCIPHANIGASGYKTYGFAASLFEKLEKIEVFSEIRSR